MPLWLVASTWAQTGGTGDTAAAVHTALVVATHTGLPVVEPPTDGAVPPDTGVVVVSAAALAGEVGGVGCAQAPTRAPWTLVGTLLLVWRRR
jgi:hypothetical protein